MSSQKDKLYLIGFMGCGKTTAGKKLAAVLDWDFIDLDKVIEQKAGLTIAEIFFVHGEEYFRKLESETLKELGNESGSVISTGGGAPCFGDNMDFMINTGLTVYLKLSPSQLKSRLVDSKTERPLIKTIDKENLLGFISDKLAQREQFYGRADLTIDCFDLDVQNLFNTVKPFINLR
jgi:shikimate kinase